MSKKVILLLDKKKLKLFSHAPSLDEARDHAEKLLEDSHKHSVCEALDYYHNTLIEQLKQDIAQLYKENPHG
jgi:hypothetical protein